MLLKAAIKRCYQRLPQKKFLIGVQGWNHRSVVKNFLFHSERINILETVTDQTYERKNLKPCISYFPIKLI